MAFAPPEWSEQRDGSRTWVLLCGKPHAYVAPSEVIAGQLGLFAARNFAKHECVSVFHGPVVDPNASESNCLVEVVRPGLGKVVIDGKDTGLPYAQMVNAHINTGRNANCKITRFGRIVTTTAVPENTEFLTKYGGGYWAKHAPRHPSA